MAVPALTREGRRSWSSKASRQAGRVRARQISIRQKYERSMQILLATRANRAMCAASSVPSTATTVYSCSRIPMLISRRKPQHVYSVRFAARELWGNQAAPQTPSTSTYGTIILAGLIRIFNRGSCRPAAPTAMGRPCFRRTLASRGLCAGRSTICTRSIHLERMGGRAGR